MIKKFKKFIESVSISDYKRFEGYINKKFYEKMGFIFRKFEDHDRNYNRIYFDLEIKHKEYDPNLIPNELRDYLNWHGYNIIDYKKGLCEDSNGRPIKIGKLLMHNDQESLLKTYVDSKKDLLKNIDDLQIVICRHPYDIIGMSTGRGWTTCLDVQDKRYGGEHLDGLIYMLREGCLVAYLIRRNDRNIKNPISRCSIKLDCGNLFVDGNIYGTNVLEFRDFLVKWCNDINNQNFF